MSPWLHPVQEYKWVRGCTGNGNKVIFPVNSLESLSLSSGWVGLIGQKPTTKYAAYLFCISALPIHGWKPDFKLMHWFSQNNVHWQCRRMNWHDSAMHAVFSKISVIKTIRTLKVKLKPNAIKQHAIDMPMTSHGSLPQLELRCLAGWATSHPAELYNLSLRRSFYLADVTRQLCSKAVLERFKALGQNSWHGTSARLSLLRVTATVVPNWVGGR